MTEEITLIRKWRSEEKLSLERACDLFAAHGFPRPNAIKFWRIEQGRQKVPTDMIPAIQKITGISARDLRPDLAELFQ